MVTKLAPKDMTGTVMGAWFLSIAGANYVAAILAKLTGSEDGAAPATAAESFATGTATTTTSASWQASSALMAGVNPDFAEAAVSVSGSASQPTTSSELTRAADIATEVPSSPVPITAMRTGTARSAQTT
jgi:hypothetical protein